MSSQPKFHSTRKGKWIGDGTVGEFVDWIEKLVNLLFPENGIEYWSDDRSASSTDYKRDHRLPEVGFSENDVVHQVCYVRQGNCEGRIIEVAVRLRNGRTKTLVWAKTFSNEDEAWGIARLVSNTLYSIFFYEEVPELVDMSNQLPRNYPWERRTSLKEYVHIRIDLNGMLVYTQSGRIIEQQHWTDDGAVGYRVEARRQDWETILNNLGAAYHLYRSNATIDVDASEIAMSLPAPTPDVNNCVVRVGGEVHA